MSTDLFWLVVVFAIAAHLERRQTTDPEADNYWGNWNPPPLHDGHYHDGAR